MIAIHSHVNYTLLRLGLLTYCSIVSNLISPLCITMLDLIGSLHYWPNLTLLVFMHYLAQLYQSTTPPHLALLALYKPSCSAFSTYSMPPYPTVVTHFVPPQLVSPALCASPHLIISSHCMPPRPIDLLCIMLAFVKSGIPLSIAPMINVNHVVLLN